MRQCLEPFGDEYQGLALAGRERARGPPGEPALPGWNAACSALTGPSRGPPIGSEILPAQPGRWACTRFGPVPGLDGIADRLRAVVSKGRFRRELGANTACAGFPGKAANPTASAARSATGFGCSSTVLSVGLWGGQRREGLAATPL